jgi:hypothetical protein
VQLFFSCLLDILITCQRVSLNHFPQFFLVHRVLSKLTSRLNDLSN